MVDARFYNINSPLSVASLADLLKVQIVAPHCAFDAQNLYLDGICTLDKASASSLAVFSSPKYRQDFLATRAGACIVGRSCNDKFDYTFLLQAENPYYTYARAIDLFYWAKSSCESISPDIRGNYISKKAKIGNNVVLGRGVIIEENVQIGDNCFIDSGVVIKQGVKIGNNANIAALCSISYAIIGDDFTALSGVRIGQDGFGFATFQGSHHKIFHVGRVLIGNRVAIGANTCIDRGSINDTIISDDCNIDNLVQIGHNVALGKGCVVAGQVGIAGSTVIGNYCQIAGQAGLAGHLKIADLVQIAGQAGVMRDITDVGSAVGGSPSLPARQWHKQSILLNKLINQRKEIQ